MADAYKPVALAKNAVVNGLIDGGAWNGTTVTYSFAAGDMNKNGISDFNEGDWKDFYREIVANIKSFTLSSRSARPATSTSSSWKAMAANPGPGTTTIDSIVGINADVTRGTGRSSAAARARQGAVEHRYESEALPARHRDASAVQCSFRRHSPINKPQRSRSSLLSASKAAQYRDGSSDCFVRIQYPGLPKVS